MDPLVLILIYADYPSEEHIRHCNTLALDGDQVLDVV